MPTPKKTMKSKLKISAGILLIFISALGAQAQLGGQGGIAPQQFDPATGLPLSRGLLVDPATGMPLAPAAPEWKDPNWKDPDITLTNVFYDSIPLSEVAKILSEQFKQQFDVLLPGDTSKFISLNGKAVASFWENDWRVDPVTLHLKNVTASEIFAAMNLLFENDRTPLRWELKVNGHRQIALLRVLVDPVPVPDPVPSPPPGPEAQRRVYFVGNLIADEKNGGMTMEQIIKTVTDVWQMANASGGNIQFHKDAQLLVVTGTPNQIDFMEQTLKALGQKVDRERNSSIRETLKAMEQKILKEKTNSGALGR